MYEQPIVTAGNFSWQLSKAMPIKENGEPLVPASYCPSRILARPQYFIQCLPNAVPEVYLREGVFERLLRAASHLPDGYRFVIYDGWRPVALQETLFDIYKKEIAAAHPSMSYSELMEYTRKFVAQPDVNPKSPSPHSTGGAVDLVIVDDRGRALFMGSGFDDTSDCSKTDWFEKLAAAGVEMSKEQTAALRNRRLLYHLMTAEGFTNYPDEWWHFDFGDQNWALLSAGPAAMYGAAVPELRWSR